MDAPLFPVKFPRPQTVEVFIIRRPDGSLVTVTREELEKLNPPPAKMQP